MTCQNVTLQLDGSGSAGFTIPLTPQVDISVPTADGSTTNTAFWQSFQPTVSGILDAVSVTYATTPVSPILEIRSGVGNGGALLYSTSVSGITNGIPLTVDIDATIDVVAGNDYSIVLTGAAAFAVQRNNSDPYADGISSIGAATDFRFSVSILQRPELDNGSTDPDGIDYWELSQSSFGCNDLGTPSVTLTAYDKLGNSASCSPTVTIEDNIAPTVSCVPFSPASQVSNSYGSSPSLAIPDNNPAGITDVLNAVSSGTVADINVNLEINHTWVGDINLTLTSPSGTTVTLIDRIGTTTGGVGCGQNDILATIDDAAGPALEDQCASPITGTYTGIDLLSAFNGEPVNGNWTVWISDNASLDFGTLISWSLDILEDIPASGVQLSLDASGNVSLSANAVNAGASDNCSVSLSVSPNTFNCTEVGIQNVTLTATDPATNSSSCNTQVLIVDDTDPTALCQNVTLQLDNSGSASLLPAQVNNGSFDNCTIDQISIDVNSFNCSDIGTNPVVLTVEDVNGNSSTCSATITVEDIETPTIICPATIVICSDDQSGSFVSYSSVVADDNCAFTVNQTDVTGLTSGDFFPIGTTIQTWTVVDEAANSASCSFNIIVNGSPEASFSYTPACQNEAIFFTDESIIDNSTSIVSWTWNMGDGSSSIGLVDPIHQYAAIGSYDVTLLVVSADGCTDSYTETVEVSPVPSASFTFVNACEGSGTVFTNTSTVALGNMNHAWDFGDGSAIDNSTSPTHVYSSSGTYTVTLTVTTDAGCEDTETMFIEVYDSPTALFTASTVCEGTATSFTNLSTGSSLSQVWDFGDGNGSNAVSPTYTYAADGTYNATLTVTNSNNCSSSYTVPVTVNNLPDVSFSFSNVCEGTPASFVNTSTPGSSNWDLGDGSSSTLTNVNHGYAAAGIYNVTLTVTSAQFCINSATDQIEVYDLPNFTLTPTDVLCYGEASGSIVAVAIPPAAAPWTLALNGGTPQSSVTFNGLSAGNYDVTAFDANGCQFTVSTTVDQPTDTLGIHVSSLNSILCHGESTGSIALNGTGGTAPYMYSLDGGTAQGSGSFSGIEAGAHTVSIIDFHSCVFDTTINFLEPDTLVLTLAQANDLLCNSDESGTISVLGTGGVAPYTYNIDGGTYSVSNTIGSLAAGTYILGVMDSNGCSDTLHVTLTEPGVLQVSLIASNDALCYNSNNGSIQVATSGGTAPYQYSLNNGGLVGSGNFLGLGADTYTVMVVDANGCTDELTETIFEPTELVIETNSVPVACFGEETGSIQIVASGGTPSYMYSIDGGLSAGVNPNFTTLEASSYLAVVEDANGCTASEGVVISQPNSAFNISADVTDVACLGGNSGSVLLIGTGGTPTYHYSSDNQSYVVTSGFLGFSAGNYTLYGMDLNGCIDSVEVIIGEPNSAISITNTISTDPACPNSATGTVLVQVSGGTPGYTYSSNNGQSFQANSILSGISGGNHVIVAMDANGCTDADTITLVSPPLIGIDVDTIIDVACENDFGGEIHVVALGGTPSYNYLLNGGSIQSNGDYVNLTDGTYQITVVDVNGCSFASSFTVEASTLLPVASFTHVVSGEAVLFTNTSDNGVSYSWSFGDGGSSTDESPVHVYDQPGDYVITLTASNDCGSDNYTTTISTINTGISSADEITFSVYPNPAKFELFVACANQMSGGLDIELYSVSGQLLSSMSNGTFDGNGRMKLDVSGLPDGMYFLRLSSEGNQSVHRFDIIK